MINVTLNVFVVSKVSNVRFTVENFFIYQKDNIGNWLAAEGMMLTPKASALRTK